MMNRRTALCCVVACLMLGARVPSAEAAFSVSINGTQVAIDNSVGDADSSAGVIHYTGKIDGYQIRLTTSTEITANSSHLTTTELRVMNTASNGTLTGPLVITIQETFSQPIGFRGEMELTNTLTRNHVAGLDPTGTVSSTTTGLSIEGGGEGTTGGLVLTNAVDAGTSYGLFNRTAEEYSLSHTITIDGLLGSRKVVVTAGSGATVAGDDVELLTAPAPASLVLLAVGVALVGAYQVRWNQLRPRV